jgi:hypothetical protein
VCQVGSLLCLRCLGHVTENRRITSNTGTPKKVTQILVSYICVCLCISKEVFLCLQECCVSIKSMNPVSAAMISCLEERDIIDEQYLLCEVSVKLSSSSTKRHFTSTTLATVFCLYGKLLRKRAKYLHIFSYQSY